MHVVLDELDLGRDQRQESGVVCVCMFLFDFLCIFEVHLLEDKDPKAALVVDDTNVKHFLEAKLVLFT